MHNLGTETIPVYSMERHSSEETGSKQTFCCAPLSKQHVAPQLSTCLLALTVLMKLPIMHMSEVEALLQLIEEVTRNRQLQRWKAVMAAWQRVLPELFPGMKVRPATFLAYAHL